MQKSFGLMFEQTTPNVTSRLGEFKLPRHVTGLFLPSILSLSLQNMYRTGILKTMAANRVRNGKWLTILEMVFDTGIEVHFYHISALPDSI